MDNSTEYSLQRRKTTKGIVSQRSAISLYPDLSAEIEDSDESDEPIEETITITDKSFSEANIYTSFIYKNPSYSVSFIALIFILLIGIFYAFRQGDEGFNDGLTKYKQFMVEAKYAIQSNFSDLSSESRVLIKHIAQKKFLEQKSKAPIMVLLAGENSLNLANTLHYILNKVQLEQKNIISSPIYVTDNINRMELQTKLTHVLKAQEKHGFVPRTAVIANVDKLLWDAVLVVHAFGDYDNYPIEDVLLFLTIPYYPASDDEVCDVKLMKHISDIWIKNGGSSDSIPPIISRLSYFICY